ncbi:membrane transporter D1-like [Saccostrea cucullata]|uniref:membrane transporter D1-like n=1 Tax=Saccostrea cuccullata TaxID=36930 RepID=UPI002ED4FC4C
MERRPLLGASDGDKYSSDNEDNVEKNLTLSEKEIDAIVTATSKQNFTKSLALAIAACVCGSSFMLGYNTGVVNTPAAVLKDFYNASYHKRYGNDPYTTNTSDATNTSDVTSTGYLSPTELSILWATTVSIFAFGGMVGGLSAGYWCNKYGRKGALLRNNLLHLIAAGLMFSFRFVYSFEMMIAGRLLVGICAGINSGAAPLYLSEIAPTSLRGFAGVFNQLAITSGVLVAQILGLDVVMGTEHLFQYVLGATVIPVAMMLCLLPWCPESPRFLMLVMKDEDEAEKALIWLRATDDVGEELEEMRSEGEKQKRMPKFTFMDLFHDRFLRDPLTISVVLQLTQQFSGINAVIYYSTEIFQTAGLSIHEAEYATLATGGVNVAMTFVSAFIMDKAGRRRLLLIGVGGLFIFSSILALSLILIKDAGISWMSYVAIVAVICYIVSFASGPGSIPWFMVAEIFSQGPRSAAVSVSTMVNWFSNFTVGLVFPILNELLIHQYSFLPFVVLLFVFLIFIYRRVPETKGKTIEEISLLFIKPEMVEYEKIIQKDDLPNYTRLQNEDSSQDSVIGHVTSSPIDKLITNAAVETTSFDIVANTSTKTLRLELDILVDLDDYVDTRKDIILESGKRKKKRKATRNTRKRWPNRVIPYIITNDFSAADRVQIKAAVDEWNKYTCLTIREATPSDVNKVRFQNGNGCSSYIGMVKGEQELNLGRNCRVAFSTNGMITVRTKDPEYQNVIGNAPGLSFLDIKLANLMYHCNVNCTVVQCSGRGFQAGDCKCYCPSDNPSNPLKVCDDTDKVTNKPTVTSTPAPNPVTETPVSDSCKNGHNYCDFWATRGHCDSSPGFMNLYCKKACGRCTKDTEFCEDVGQHCNFWKTQGYCAMNMMPYMQRSCRKTCGYCTSDEGNGEGIAQPLNAGKEITAKTAFVIILTIVQIIIAKIL